SHDEFEGTQLAWTLQEVGRVKTRIALSMKAMCALAAAAVIAIGCSDTGRSPTSPAHTGATGATELLGGGLHLLHCSQQSYDSVTQVVDSSGGTIYVGSHVFTIPAGAIDSAVTITAVTPSVNRR